MNAQTLKALKGSIKKWEGIVEGTGTDRGDKNCPLCKLFLRKCAPGNKPCMHCVGCPVYEKMGRSSCMDSPYDDWSSYLDQNDRENGKVFDRRSKQLAKNELEFLKGLLPVSAIKSAKPVGKVARAKKAAKRK